MFGMTEIRYGGKFIQPIVLALGYFDCVHRGHSALLARAGALASKQNAISAAFTFADGEGYPAVTGKLPIYGYLDRVRRMGEEGVRVTVYADFDKKFQSLPAQKFLDKLFYTLHLRGIVAGGDFMFGKGGKGNIDTLKKYCERRKIELEIMPDFLIDGERVSSSKVRELLERGQIEAANALLGAPYRHSGLVLPGRGLGSRIGIGTANLALLPGRLRLGEGIYATYCLTETGLYPSVTSVGTQPTVGGTDYRAEAHIFDFHQNLHGKPLTILYVKRLRSVVKFPSVEDMVRQIDIDIAEAKAVLGGTNAKPAATRKVNELQF